MKIQYFAITAAALSFPVVAQETAAPAAPAAAQVQQAAGINFYTQSAEEICAAGWHSQLAKQHALCTLAAIRCVPPGQNLSEEESVKLAQILARESTPEGSLSPILPLYFYCGSQMKDATPQERLQWLESRFKPYLDTDNGSAHVVLAALAAQCGQDPMPHLKASASAGQLQGLIGYASRCCMVMLNDADEMQRCLVAAAPKMVNATVGNGLRANMLMNMAESCEMKGGAFDALRGPCLAWAYGVYDKDDEYAYLLPAYYENWDGLYWRCCAFMRLAKLSPSVYSYKHLAKMSEEMGQTEQAEMLHVLAERSGYQEGKDYLHNFPHGCADSTTNIVLDPKGLDKHDRELLTAGVRNAVCSKQKGTTGDSGEVNSAEFVELLTELGLGLLREDEDRDSKESLLRQIEDMKAKCTEKNAGDAYFFIYRAYKRMGDNINALDYLMKSADEGNGEAFYELAKQAGPTSEEYATLLSQAVSAGCGEAAFQVFKTATEHPERVNNAAFTAAQAMSVALAANYAPACDYAAEKEKDNPSAYLLLRAMAAADCCDRIPALDTALADYAKAHPETQAVVRAIRTAILSSVKVDDFEDAAQARRALETLRGLLKEYGMSAEESQARTAALEAGITAHFKK